MWSKFVFWDWLKDEIKPIVSAIIIGSNAGSISLTSPPTTTLYRGTRLH